MRCSSVNIDGIRSTSWDT